jgi:trehalose 2-sulfotransferase
MPTTPPRLAYLVCATHRSGSNLLCQVLWHTGRAGYPQEAFSPTRAAVIAAEHAVPHDPATCFAAYVADLMARRQTPNGVFGAKIMWSQVPWFVERLHADPGWTGGSGQPLGELLPAVFPGLRFVWMRRRDKVRQAISLVKAKQTRIYNSLQAAGAPPPPAPAYDFTAIERERQRFEDDDASWERFFADSGHRPFALCYEDIVAQPSPLIRDLLRHLGEDVPDDYEAPRTTYQRLSDSVNDEWFERFERERRA